MMSVIRTLDDLEFMRLLGRFGQGFPSRLRGKEGHECENLIPNKPSTGSVDD
jgi:hypothetical protein